MDEKIYRGKTSKEVYELLVACMHGLECDECTIRMALSLLKEPQLQYELIEWISKTMKEREPVEEEILSKAIEISVAEIKKEAEKRAIYKIENGVGIIPEGATEIVSGGFCGKRLTSVAIPDSVRIIREGAFDFCKGLASITIPANVLAIEEWAFSKCEDLERVTVAEGNPIYDSRGDCNAIIESATNKLIVGCMNTIIPSSVKIIGDCAFSSCYNLTSVIIPEGVTIIEENAFSATGLTSVNIPASVTTIDSAAFCCCDSLTSVTISQNSQLTTIGEDAFDECENLISINLPAGVKSIGEGAFSFCDALRRVSVPAGMTDYFKGLLPEELHEYIVEEN
jgi:hypothetical protein